MLYHDFVVDFLRLIMQELDLTLRVPNQLVGNAVAEKGRSRYPIGHRAPSRSVRRASNKKAAFLREKRLFANFVGATGFEPVTLCL